MGEAERMRIGTLAKRSGVAEATLRAWERRYGIPVPKRTEGGHRVYDERDLARVQRVQRLVDHGWTVGAAARKVARETDLAAATERIVPPISRVAPLLQRLEEATDRYDSRGILGALDAAVAACPVDQVIDDIVFPYWMHHHKSHEPKSSFGLTVVSGWAFSMFHDLDSGGRGRVVVAGGPSAYFSLGSLLAAIVAARADWAVSYLGGAVATAVIESAIEDLGAAAALVYCCHPSTADRFVAERETAQQSVVIMGPDVPAGIEASGVKAHRGRFEAVPTALDDAVG